jgi:hypothetical protein
MENKNKIYSSFANALNISEDQIQDSLAYQSISEWDSIFSYDIDKSIRRRF